MRKPSRLSWVSSPNCVSENPVKASYLCGLIGAGIQLSRAPALHEREADAQGLRYVYKLYDLD